MNFTRWQSMIICLFVYVLVFAGAWKYTDLYEDRTNLLLAALIADVIATIIVFVFSLLYKNSSLYDPYWSVIPPAIAITLKALLKADTVTGPWLFTSPTTFTLIDLGCPILIEIFVPGGTTLLNLL